MRSRTGADLGFGVGGQALTSLGATNDQLSDVLIDGKGRIVAAGQIEVAGHNQLAVARYKPSGALDATFGSGGVAQQPVGTDSFGAAVARDGKGRILVAGASDGQLVVARFRSDDGSPDTSFGTGVVVKQPIGFQDAATEVSVDSQGRIVVVGYVQPVSGQPFDALVLRLRSSGDLDDSFGGGDGIVTEHFGDEFRSTTARLGARRQGEGSS